MDQNSQKMLKAISVPVKQTTGTDIPFSVPVNKKTGTDKELSVPVQVF
jgi:hypothetical protein